MKRRKRRRRRLDPGRKEREKEKPKNKTRVLRPKTLEPVNAGDSTTTWDSSNRPHYHPQAPQPLRLSSHHYLLLHQYVILFFIYLIFKAGEKIEHKMQQDLLKCIHHFASEHYADHGQLYNATREARLERKAARVRRLAAQAPGSISPHKKAIANEADEDEDDDDDDDSGDEHEPPSTTYKRQKHKSDPNTLGRDMYKSMDGSALMAIGLLLSLCLAVPLMLIWDNY
jgi:hypothetical protein